MIAAASVSICTASRRPWRYQERLNHPIRHPAAFVCAFTKFV